MSSGRHRLREVHTEDNGTWLVQVAQGQNGFWYVVDQARSFEAPLRHVGPFESLGAALDVAYDRYASALEHATISAMSVRSRQATRSRHQMPAVLETLGVTQGQFEDMVATIEREGYFDLGPNEEGGIVTIDRDYSLHELGLDGLDEDQGG